MKPDDPIAVIQASDAMSSVQQAQELAAIKNAAKRQAERQEKMDAWQDPDAMANRKLIAERQAFESLMQMKASGNAVDQIPIPPLSELPPDVRIQQPSYIRKWMAYQPKYRDSTKAWHKKQEDDRTRRKKLIEKYPEMFGVTDYAARAEMAGKSTEDYRVRNEHYSIAVKEAERRLMDLTRPPEPSKPAFVESLRYWFGKIGL